MSQTELLFQFLVNSLEADLGREHRLGGDARFVPSVPTAIMSRPADGTSTLFEKAAFISALTGSVDVNRIVTSCFDLDEK